MSRTPAGLASALSAAAMPALGTRLLSWTGLSSLGPPVAVRGFVAWALVLLALQVLGLGGTPLFDVDEGAFSAATREMLASGDWGHTTLNGEPRFDKPILIYWLQAASVSLFGLDEFALRLPSALAAWGWAVTVGAFAMARWGLRAGVCAGTVLATSLGVTLIGRAATADALLNLWLALAALDLWRAVDPQARGGQRAAVRRAATWIGLGLLTKGPVALLVPGAAVVLWLSVEGWRAPGSPTRSAPDDRPPTLADPTRLARSLARRGMAALGRIGPGLRGLLNDPLAWVLLLVVAVPWYAYALQRHGMAFVDGFLWRHNLQRYGGTLEGHGGAWFYYLALLPVLLFPWSTLLPSLRWRTIWVDPLGRYLLLWAGFVLVFFSGSGTKLPHYLLYGLTPLALLIGRRLSRPDREPVQARRSIWSLRLLGVSLIATPLLAAALVEGVRALARHDALGPAAAMQVAQLTAGGPTWLLWLSAAGTTLLIASVWNPFTLRTGVWRPLLAAALGLMFTVEMVLPWWGERLQGPVRDLAHAARRWQAGAIAKPDATDTPRPTVVQWGLHQPSFSVYLGDISPRRAPQPGELALVRSDRLSALAQERHLAAGRSGREAKPPIAGGADTLDGASPTTSWTVLDRAPGLLLIRWTGPADLPPTAERTPP